MKNLIFASLILVSYQSQAQSKLSDLASPIIDKTCAAAPYYSACIQNHPEFYLQSALDPNAKTIEQRQESKVGIYATENRLGEKIFVGNGAKNEHRFEYAKSNDGSEYVLEYLSVGRNESGAEDAACANFVKVKSGNCESVEMNDSAKELFSSDVKCKNQVGARKSVGIKNCTMLAESLKSCLKNKCHEALQKIYAKGESESLPKPDPRNRPQGERDEPGTTTGQ